MYSHSKESLRTGLRESPKKFSSNDCQLSVIYVQEGQEIPSVVRAMAVNKQYLASIAPASVELGPIPFDLYTPLGNRMVLFCRAGFSITEHHKEILERIDRPFYIRSDDMADYVDYTFERLERIVSSPDIRASDKAEIVHRVGKRAVHKLMENPRSGEVIMDSKKVVENYVELILRSTEAASHLFALSALDSYIFSHSVNVCTFCVMLGQILHGGDRKTLWELGLAGLIHDVGKSRIDPVILLKPGPLSPKQMDIVRHHPIYSLELVREHGLSEAIQEAGHHHHERMDGTGYPDNLTGKDIHPVARLVAVADVYDAITSDRIYKASKPHVKALKEMARTEEAYDPDIFDALLNIVLRHDKLVEDFQRHHLKRGVYLRTEDDFPVIQL